MIWKSFIEGYRQYLLLECAVSSHTIAGYLSDLRKVEEYDSLSGKNLGPLKFELDDIRDFLKYINDLGLSARSQARLISAVNGFYKFLLLENVTMVNPAEYIDLPRIGRKLPVVLSYEEIELLIHTIDLTKPEGTRNKAIIETLYSCGLRVSELVNLKLSNLFFDEDFIRVTGKGNKERLVPIGPEAIKYITIYLDEIRRHQKVGKESGDIVFLNRRGNQLTRVMIFTIVRNIAEKTGIKKVISPHTFRHSFATHMVEGGADLRVVQDLLGHQSITTTEIYTHLDTDYLRSAINDFHPRYR